MRHSGSGIALVSLFLHVLTPAPAAAYGGGLDRNGCHTNRKTGEYHCHRAPLSSPPPGSVPVTRNVSGPVTVQAPATTAENDAIRTAQVLLRALGYQPSMLGSLDERTRAAIRAFQRAETMKADGAVSAYLILRLAEKVAARCP
jgi:hypothetical protein